MNNKSSEYKNIFKSTFLFGFVQIFNILTKVLLNKAAAVFLGSEGIGLIGIFQSISEMLKTFFGLGVSQSAVRDISKANKDGDKKEFSTIITVTHKIIWFTSFIGAIFTFVFSSYLSIWSFGDESYTFAFMLLSVVIFFSILADGQLGILKGMRQLRSLAKATIFGSFVGLITGVPFYYFLGTDGIVPTLLAVALSLIVFSTYYVKKVEYEKVKISLKETFSKSSSMIKMGVALMFVSFLTLLHYYLLKIYIANISSLEMVGIFQVGTTIISGYFGIIITAMATDYYPKVSSIYNDNMKLKSALNQQSEVGLLLITPILVIFIFVMPLFIELLYTKEFLQAIDYIKFAVYGIVIYVCSNPLRLILLAKQDVKLFMWFSVVFTIIGLSTSLYLFKLYSIEGLGIAEIIVPIFYIIVLQTIMFRKYKIYFNKNTIFIFIFSILITSISLYFCTYNFLYIRYMISFFLFLFSTVFAFRYLKKEMNIDIINIIKVKLKLH